MRKSTSSWGEGRESTKGWMKRRPPPDGTKPKNTQGTSPKHLNTIENSTTIMLKTAQTQAVSRWSQHPHTILRPNRLRYDQELQDPYVQVGSAQMIFTRNEKKSCDILLQNCVFLQLFQNYLHRTSHPCLIQT